MAKARKRLRTKRPRTAAEARVTVEAVVESPYGHGIDRPRCVVDTVEVLHRRGSIDDVDLRAARRYRAAFDRSLMVPSLMDPDRVAGGGGAGGLCEAAMQAAHDLVGAHRQLGVLAPVVTAVVGRGHSLEDLAVRLYGSDKRDAVQRASGLARSAIRELACLWWPGEAGKSLSAILTPGKECSIRQRVNPVVHAG